VMVLSRALMSNRSITELDMRGNAIKCAVVTRSRACCRVPLV
jgi:hypothetical protein